MKIVYNVTKNKFEFQKSLIRVALGIYNGILEFGYCSADDERLLPCSFCYENVRVCFILNTKENKERIVYSNLKGCYIFKNSNETVMARETKILGRGGFPYNFDRHYEAVEVFGLFKNKQQVLNKVYYNISEYLKYTFGVEFETFSGYIPQHLCYRDGLIPLRDGSLDGGIEYSTIVLQGNEGINLLKQQVDTLKEYTYFNKECSLHFHFGGFPVEKESIWSLYLTWMYIHNDIQKIVPELTFNSDQYKNTGKNYCKSLPAFKSFNHMFKFLTDSNYFGDLTQPHPSDPEKRAKWNISSRYYDLNLLNMVCYKGPKTVEFRFLRPTFNFHKILLWLYIFNAILMFSEDVAYNSDGLEDITRFFNRQEVSLAKIIRAIYPSDLAKTILNDITNLEIVIINQANLNDYIGATTAVEDKLIDPNIVI